MADVTEWLHAAQRGDEVALGRLFELLYPDLRRIAHARLRGSAQELLNTTALVHESFLRLVRLERLEVADRPRFLAYVARVMRSIVVDLVRAARAARRGGGEAALPLDTGVDAEPAGAADAAEVLRVHEALAELGAHDERLVRVVELRYFAGLEMEEVALALGVGKRTAERDWERARLFLYQSLRN
ncbi:ECF-type sigma factor [Aquabacterium humicola]|uniref:ECF-type sigma factor n=1 Tax=Aquabacterium humicola TaxID=3237377 RepID=UPI002542A778|nr:ECF-type sigma factor [Rubrivivax pictus]